MSNYPSLVEVALTDTFDSWRGKTNVAIQHTDRVATVIGEVTPANMGTTAGTLVTAIKEVDTETTTNTTNIGTMANINALFKKPTVVETFNELNDTLRVHINTEVSTERNEREAADVVLQQKVDQVEASSGLAGNGNYIVQTGSNYLTTANTLAAADTALDTTLKSISDELNTTQTTLGTGADGTKTFSGTYIGSTMSYAEAIESLDTQANANNIKTNTNTTNISTLDSRETSRYNELTTKTDNTQAELDRVEEVIGTIANGTMTISGTNYINGVTVKAALIALDEKAKANADGVVAASSGRNTLQQELNTTQNGAGLNNLGTYSANTGANYINTASSLKNADNLLDGAVKANADAILALQGRADNVDTDLGSTITRNSLSADEVHIFYNSGTGKFAHNTISSAAVSTSGATIISSLTVDTAGHLTGSSTRVLGNQSLFNQTISTSNPSGGANGDVWYKV